MVDAEAWSSCDVRESWSGIEVRSTILSHSDAGCSREFVSMIHLKACKAHFVVRRAADVPAPFYADDPAEVVDVVLR